MGCKHYDKAAFWTKQGDCDQCLREKIRQLEEENRRLKRDLQATQVALGNRQEID